jgi:chromosome segregation protein
MLTEKAEYDAKLIDVKEVIAASTARLEETRANSRRVHDSEQQLRGELSEARERRSAVASRIQTLQEMQDRLEGVASGVRRAVEARRAGKLPCLRGMLGDFLQTDTAHAALVEAALAGADQQLLVDRAADLTCQADALRAALGGSAAVEVLCLDRLGPLGQDFQPSDCPQARGRVIDHVRFEGVLAPLMWRLLGTTLMVDTLADALSAAGTAPAGFRFVTQAGEVLEADGRIRFGAANRGAGVITRRSELAELHAERAALVERIEGLETQCTSAHNELQHLDELQHGLRTAVYEANTERVECQSRLGQLDEQLESLRREQPVVAKDIEALAEDIDGTIQAEGEARRKAEELEEMNRQRQAQIQQIEQRIAEARASQQEVTNRMTEMKVALAAVDEKKRSAREALDGVVRAAQAMRLDLDKDRAQIDLDRQRKADAQAAIEKAAGEVERLFAEQQQLNIEAAEVEESRAGLQQKLEEIRVQLAEKRKAHAAAQDALGAVKIELGEVDVRVENLIARAGEEMGMDLLELCKGYQHDEQRDWQAVEAEIQDLRTKIEHLGNVNLDAIAEQEELDKRREFLTTQVKDIQESHQQLNELIRKINKESRDMFLETFEAVRQQFQTLFRKLFGGGKADILMLDPENVLECGIEIIARPPGKETRSLSLLSGGEKTMTALSLMFSIFRCRPSPFCLLDEVDAALDEQNTERFTRLVGEFVDTSQFLIISHSKRTMSMSDVLYGVTMQEPGVSKRISVRFEEAGKSADEQLEPAGVS